MRSSNHVDLQEARRLMWKHILFFSRERRAYTVSQELAEAGEAYSGSISLTTIRILLPGIL